MTRLGPSNFGIEAVSGSKHFLFASCVGSMAEKLKQFASAAAAAALNLSRPNYFDNGRKGNWLALTDNIYLFEGENYELKKDLNSDLQLVRKEAVKKVIASMTIGKDVGALFPDVLKNIQTDDIELKKLVYLYLMNYATSHPELVVLAINTFCKVTGMISFAAFPNVPCHLGCFR